jgi:hypothetical protein
MSGLFAISAEHTTTAPVPSVMLQHCSHISGELIIGDPTTTSTEIPRLREACGLLTAWRRFFTTTSATVACMSRAARIAYLPVIIAR